MDPHEVVRFMWQRLNRHEATYLLNYVVDMTIVFQYLRHPGRRLEAKRFPRALQHAFDMISWLMRTKPLKDRKKILQVLFASTKYDRPDLRNEPVAILQVERVLVALANEIQAMDEEQFSLFREKVQDLIARKLHVLWDLYMDFNEDKNPSLISQVLNLNNKKMQ